MSISFNFLLNITSLNATIQVFRLYLFKLIIQKFKTYKTNNKSSINIYTLPFIFKN